MKATFLFALLLLASPPAFSQSAVDRAVRALDSLGTVSYDHWRISPDLKGGRDLGGDPTKPGFDDSGWDDLTLNQRVFPETSWIRKTIVLPDRILGKPVSGPVRLLVSVDDYGYMWVDGRELGYFPWDGEFELTADARPGQKFLIAIKAVNTGGPLRLIRAEIETDDSKPLRTSIRDLTTSLRVGQKLVGFDTYQTNSHKKIDPGTDRSAMDRGEKTRLNELLQGLAARIDVDALAAGDIEKYSASVAAVREGLKPVGEFAKRFTLWFDANAHIDAAWLWREGETVEVCRNTFTSVLNMMDARPDFTYTQSAAAYYDWMERLAPDVYKRIAARVKDGRWEVVGGMWVEPDCNLPGGESWARHLLYAKRYFRQKLGADVTIGYNPDSFGYNWNMPQFYREAGIDAFITQKMGWSETNVFPHRVFWWEAPDGSRVLTCFPFDYVNTIEDPFRMAEQLRQFESNTGFTTMPVLFGVGDHGGGPTPEMLERVDHLRTLDVYPAIRTGTLGAYLDWLKGRDLTTLPVWKDELYLEYHRGTYTTQSETKKANRESEVLLTNAEKVSTVASLFGKKYPGEELATAWKDVLFNQFHDILPGSGIREVYIDAAERFGRTRRAGSFILNDGLGYLAGRVNTASLIKGRAVVVFNPLSWSRTDAVPVRLPDGDVTSYAVFTTDGREVPSQQVGSGPFDREVLFVAKDVPPLGYATYELRKRDRAGTDGGSGAVSPGAAGTSIGNEFFDLTVDDSTGWISSITDKRTGREVLAGEGNRLQLLEDRPRAWDAWNIGLTGVEYPTRLKKIELTENGPVRWTIRVTRDYLKPGVEKDYPTEHYASSFFTQEISLSAGIDRIDFRTFADWWEEKTMVKVAFPVSVADSMATYEIPYGTIRRSTGWRDSFDSAKVEVSAQRWADLSQDDYGVSLLNRAKYGYDIKGNTMRLSLLRSPVWPDPTADRGKHTIEYALYPHAGRWQAARTVRRGYEYNDPLTAMIVDARKGTLPVKNSFVSLEPANLVLATIKKAEDSPAWVIQWYDSEGKGGDAVLTLPATPKKVVNSDFLENDLEALSIDANIVRVPTRAGGVRTIKVYF